MGKEIEGAVLQPSERLSVRLTEDVHEPGRFVAQVYFRIGTWKGMTIGTGATAEDAIWRAEQAIKAEREKRGV